MPITHSPLRYPGGKTQLANYIKYLLQLNGAIDTYIEPFAGGFGVGLELLYSNLVNKVVLNDLDPSIYSIWFNILNNADEFVSLIKNTDITISTWNKMVKIRKENYRDSKSIDNGFASFFLNRTNVSGIINGGPIGGKEQTGKYKLDCRFNKKKLIEKVEKISKYRDRIILNNLDANKFIKQEVPKYNSNSTFIFFDPPYYSQGKNLYLSFLDKDAHKELAKNILSLIDYKWIVTYDMETKILDLYEPFVKSYMYSLNYSARKKRKAKEFIFINNNTRAYSFDKVKLEKIKEIN